MISATWQLCSSQIFYFLNVCFWEMELIGIDSVSQIAWIGILWPNMDKKFQLSHYHCLKMTSWGSQGSLHLSATIRANKESLMNSEYVAVGVFCVNIILQNEQVFPSVVFSRFSHLLSMFYGVLLFFLMIFCIQL